MRIIYFLVFYIISFSAYSAGWSNPLTVTQIYAYGDSDLVLVSTDGGSAYNNSCITDEWELKATNEKGKDRIYSALLSASLSGTEVRLWFGDSCGANNYHTFNTLRLVK